MKVPIAYGLSFPERINSGADVLDFRTLAALTFEPPDHSRYPGLALAWSALRAPAGSTAVLNAANEEAVAAFLNRAIRFDQIDSVNQQVLDNTEVGAADALSLEALLSLDQRARLSAQRVIGGLSR
jgi:1-deoxy-D-xylulose-5-phosphate reductoisomerase